MPVWLAVFFGTVGVLAAAAGIWRWWLSLTDRRRRDFEDHFREARGQIKRERSKLQQEARTFAAEHRASLRLHDAIPLLVRDGWIPDAPTELDRIRPVFSDNIVPTLWSDAPRVGHFSTYYDAVLSLDKPEKAIDNKSQYRLLSIAQNTLTFSNRVYHYLDKINFGGILEFELAYAKWHGGSQAVRSALVGKLSAPHEYLIFAGVNTLTLLNDHGHLRLIMHHRDPRGTSMAMGLYHVIPAGEFQPSCKAPTSFTQDFDLWKNIMRESAEELLGMKEYDGDSGVPFNYQQEPFVSLEREKAAGNIKAFYLGVGLDPVTFQAEILTCVVYKEDVFARIFHPIITKNDEGTIITEENRWGCDMTEDVVSVYDSSNTLAAGEAVLRLVAQNRSVFERCFE